QIRAIAYLSTRCSLWIALSVCRLSGTRSHRWGMADQDSSVTQQRIAFIQYTNPAGYPPLQHSAEILVEHGWTVSFLGTGASGGGGLRFAANERIHVHQMPFSPPGWRQKLHYLYFHLWCIGWLIRWRPALVYASDLFAAPLAWFASAVLRLPVVFHEHDGPSPLPSGWFLRFCHWMRRCSARRAMVCVLPNLLRAADFSTALRTREPLVVCNCPRLQEVSPRRRPIQDDRLRLLYQGSIVPERLPLAVVNALNELPDGVSLTVIGY